MGEERAGEGRRGKKMVSDSMNIVSRGWQESIEEGRRGQEGEVR